MVTDMKIAVIGSGGREHAIIKRIAQSDLCKELYALPGNGGIAADATCVPVQAGDKEGIVDFCTQKQMDYVVVAPDDPLAAGVVDALAKAGVPAFGPTAKAARIESSKIFSKNLMKKYGIPTADFQVFTQKQEAVAYLEKRADKPVVVKADGLALGKGVLICQTNQEAKAAVEDMMENKLFGESGSRIVIEEFITGPEVSVLAFCDGKTLVPMVSSMDHKRALDGDKGLNTGGMGAVAPNPFYTKEIENQCMKEIFLPTVEAMEKEGAPFKGCLYFGLMLTPEGPKVIEYNCRFGDPETQVVLPLLEGDLLQVMMACTTGTLNPELVRIRPGAAACVVMASGGYPSSYKTGLPVEALGKVEMMADTDVFHAGTRLEKDEVVTAGGRVVGITATAPDLEEAIKKVYKAVESISFRDAHYRRDIGKQALEVSR